MYSSADLPSLFWQQPGSNTITVVEMYHCAARDHLPIKFSGMRRYILLLWHCVDEVSVLMRCFICTDAVTVATHDNCPVPMFITSCSSSWKHKMHFPDQLRMFFFLKNYTIKRVIKATNVSVDSNWIMQNKFQQYQQEANFVFCKNIMR